jgi:hypothetical protein
MHRRYSALMLHAGLVSVVAGPDSGLQVVVPGAADLERQRSWPAQPLTPSTSREATPLHTAAYHGCRLSRRGEFVCSAGCAAAVRAGQLGRHSAHERMTASPLPYGRTHAVPEELLARPGCYKLLNLLKQRPCQAAGIAVLQDAQRVCAPTGRAVALQSHASSVQPVL